jgi:hypothetical protein
VLLVPAALVAALLVLGLAGGFGTLGSLGQAFAGPSVPVSARIAGVPVAAHRARALPVVAAPTLIASRTPVVAGGGSAVTTPNTPASQGIGSSGPGRGTTAGTPAGKGPGNGTGSGGGRGGGGSGTGGSGGGTHGSSSLVDNVVNLGTSLTKTIPGPVGGLATQLLQSLAKTVDGVLPQAAHPTPASPVTGLVKGLVNGLHLP